MPNWCENTLEIYGEEEDMQQFYDFFLGQDKIQENFSFDAITTMPKALEGTRSPSQIIPQNHYDLLEKFKHEIDLNSTEKDMQNQTMISKSDNKEFSEFESVNEILKQFFLDSNDGITKETSDRLISEYGFDNWYDWRNHNWGTKWDIKGDVGINDIDNEILLGVHLNRSYISYRRCFLNYKYLVGISERDMNMQEYLNEKRFFSNTHDVIIHNVIMDFD